MGLTGIISLAAGCIIFILSFVLPEKKRSISKEDIKLGEEQVKKLVEREMQGARSKISDLVEETVADGLEKTERSLDRLSNEKIMAVNEYSDTVLEAINTNHKEVIFLYDMLNNKQEALKEAVREASMAERKVKEQAEAVREQEAAAEALQPEPVQEAAPVPKTAPKKRQSAKKTTKSASSAKASKEPEAELLPGTDGDDDKNSNEQILALHKEGKSNLAIAKALGLGIGEVKLVIDLYEGM